MEHLEIEVKFFIKHPDLIRSKLKNLGAKSNGCVFETNIRFEDKENSLIAKNALLRLRKDNCNRLTYKCEPDEKDSNYKIYRELEVEVSDFSITQEILEALGYHPEQIYEKWRETFVISDTTLCLDQMPFGHFMEIEGPKNKIHHLSEELGFYWDQRILHNYLKIFEIIKEMKQLPFSDITFDNFKKYPACLSQKDIHLFM
jgi:adenylate cyclase class 2